MVATRLSAIGWRGSELVPFLVTGCGLQQQMTPGGLGGMGGTAWRSESPATQRATERALLALANTFQNSSFAVILSRWPFHIAIPSSGALPYCRVDMKR